MITIDQLLESVDLDFEPGWVTKDEDGTVNIWEEKPERCYGFYCIDNDNIGEVVTCPKLKLSEFADKNWKECIYEVPRKTTVAIEKLDGEFKEVHFHELNAFCITGEAFGRLTSKINEIIDWINDSHKDSK